MAQGHDFHRYGKATRTHSLHPFDAHSLGEAITEMNRLVESHAPLLQHDTVLAGGILHYENLLIDAQCADALALKQVATTTAFDKLLEMVNSRNAASTNASARQEAALDVAYYAMYQDLLKFRTRFLSGNQGQF